jgi:hypothetical protein
LVLRWPRDRRTVQTGTARRGRPNGDGQTGTAKRGPVAGEGLILASGRRETSSYACVHVSSTVTSVEDADRPL